MIILLFHPQYIQVSLIKSRNKEARIKKTGNKANNALIVARTKHLHIMLLMITSKIH